MMAACPRPILCDELPLPTTVCRPPLLALTTHEYGAATRTASRPLAHGLRGVCRTCRSARFPLPLSPPPPACFTPSPILLSTATMLLARRPVLLLAGASVACGNLCLLLTDLAFISNSSCSRLRSFDSHSANPPRRLASQPDLDVPRDHRLERDHLPVELCGMAALLRRGASTLSYSRRNGTQICRS